MDKPLTCRLPKNTTLATEPKVTYVSPAGRDVHVTQERPSSFSLEFPTLNTTEFFVLKIIVDSNITYQDLVWTITAENLPPDIKVEGGERIVVQTWSRSDNSRIATSSDQGIIFRAQQDYSSRVTALASRVLLLVFGLSVLLMLYFVVQYAAPAINVINTIAFLASLLCGFSLAMVGLVGTSIAIVSLSRPRKRFDVPEGVGPPFNLQPNLDSRGGTTGSVEASLNNSRGNLNTASPDPGQSPDLPAHREAKQARKADPADPSDARRRPSAP